MYRAFFGLKEPPFSIAPDPRYLYMSAQHREALAHLIYGIRSDGGFVLLTGEVGTGKTTVCRSFLEHLPQNTDIAFILNPKLTVPELLATLCDELGIRYPEATDSVKVFVDRINAHLLEAHAKGRKTVLIIEEAQNLGTDVLEQVRLLTNLETNEQKLLQIIMVGQPELRAKLSRPELRQLAQRITARYHLCPLTKRELIAYVKHRLTVAGAKQELFSSSSVRKLYRLSRGIPRLINILCDRALLGAYAQGKKEVDKPTLVNAAQEVLQEQKSPRQRPSKALRWASASALLLLVLTILAATLYNNRPHLFALNTATESTEPILRAEADGPAPPASDSLRWPPDQPFHLSKEMAFQALFSRWNLPYQIKEHESACQQVQAKGMRCLNAQGSLSSLLSLNRPAVIKLFDDKDREFYAAIIALQGPIATIFVGTDKRTVDIKEIAMRWLGDYTLLWRTPPDFNTSLTPGEKGKVVPWLSRQLAAIQGRKPRVLKSSLYNNDLVRQVKKFQLAEGLVPNGIVGPQTVIHLNTATGSKEPVLMSTRMVDYDVLHP